MFCQVSAPKTVSSTSAARQIFVPSVSLLPLVFWSPEAAVPRQSLPLPKDSGPQGSPKSKHYRSRLERIHNTFVVFIKAGVRLLILASLDNLVSFLLGDGMARKARLFAPGVLY